MRFMRKDLIHFITILIYHNAGIYHQKVLLLILQKREKDMLTSSSIQCYKNRTGERTRKVIGWKSHRFNRRVKPELNHDLINILKYI